MYGGSDKGGVLRNPQLQLQILLGDLGLHLIVRGTNGTSAPITMKSDTIHSR